jgi:hypothetical protein
VTASSRWAAVRYSNVPNAEIESETEAEQEERGVTPAGKAGGSPDAVKSARDAKLARLRDAWKNPFSPMASPSAAYGPSASAGGSGGNGRATSDAAYQAKLARVSNAWSGVRAKPWSESDANAWRLAHL